jgi:hypothetical protein
MMMDIRLQYHPEDSTIFFFVSLPKHIIRNTKERKKEREKKY